MTRTVAAGVVGRAGVVVIARCCIVRVGALSRRCVTAVVRAVVAVTAVQLWTAGALARATDVEDRQDLPGRQGAVENVGFIDDPAEETAPGRGLAERHGSGVPYRIADT